MSFQSRLPGFAPMVLCSVFAAALAACGGGSGSAAGSAATAAASDGSADAAVDVGTAPGADAGTGVVSTLGAKVSNLPVREGFAFMAPGTNNVQFGANGKFVVKTVNGRGDCTVAFFGADPAPGAAKSCQIATAASTTAKTGSTTTASTTTASTTTASTTTSTPTTAATTSTPTTSPTTTSPTTSATTATATTTAAPVASLMPTIDKSKIPAPATGFSTARVMAANLADPGQIPVPSDIGDFRETCDFSHMSYDDPIVAPGAVGSHLHTFLGNTGTNANSTATSIATTGNSTCAGGTANRTAYWVPTMIDTTDGTPLTPSGSMIYYKQGYNNIPSASIKPFPAGLRIVAGNSASSSAQSNTGFTCFKPDGTNSFGPSIPTDCPSGSTLVAGVAFPQCWDGVNLDSPDHKSHMAYPGNGCPSTHPVPLTGITINVDYKVGANGTSKWRLSSDNYDHSLPGGFSIHADWFGGWNTDILNTWTTRCINATMDCHAYLIGDGRILY